MRSEPDLPAGGRSLSLRVAAVAALAGACSGVLVPEQAALDTARERWAAASPASYVYVVQRSCFCLTDFVRPIRVEVREGEVVSATYADSGEPVTNPDVPIPTVPDLFTIIQEALDAGAHSIVATYDGELGYPMDVSIDYLEMAIDEELAFSVREFELL